MSSHYVLYTSRACGQHLQNAEAVLAGNIAIHVELVGRLRAAGGTISGLGHSYMLETVTWLSGTGLRL